MNNNIEIMSKVVSTLPQYPNVMYVSDILDTLGYVRCYDPNSKEYNTIDHKNLIVVGEPPKVQSKKSLLKVYVIIKDSAPLGLGINAVAHLGFMLNVLSHTKHFDDWKTYSFKNVTCLVTDKQYEEAIDALREEGDSQGFIEFIEPDWEGSSGKPIGAVFAPRYSFPPIFKTFKLHSGEHLK